MTGECGLSWGRVLRYQERIQEGGRAGAETGHYEGLPGKIQSLHCFRQLLGVWDPSVHSFRLPEGSPKASHMSES